MIMMTHDPFQTYQAFGAYPGISGYAGYPQTFQGAGVQGAGLPLSQGYGQPFQQSFQTQNPLTAGLQNPLQQSPFMQTPWQQIPWIQNAALQHQILQNQILQQQLSQNPLTQNPFAQVNPLLAASLQHQQFNPALAYHGWPQQQQQFNYPLAPQSLIGAGGIGQIHPLAHAALRQAAAYGYPTAAGYC